MKNKSLVIMLIVLLFISIGAIAYLISYIGNEVLENAKTLEAKNGQIEIYTEEAEKVKIPIYDLNKGKVVDPNYTYTGEILYDKYNYENGFVINRDGILEIVKDSRKELAKIDGKVADLLVGSIGDSATNYAAILMQDGTVKLSELTSNTLSFTKVPGVVNIVKILRVKLELKNKQSQNMATFIAIDKDGYFYDLKYILSK